MNATEDFKNAMGLIPLRYQKAVITLLAPHFSPEMLAVSVDYLNREEPSPLNPNEVIELVFKIVSDVTGVTDFRSSKSRTRKSEFVFARQLAMFAIYSALPQYGYGQVGKLFTPQFDHATIIYASKSMEARYAADKSSREVINAVADIMAEHSLYAFQNRLKIIQLIA